jgi:hypothetical protein
MHPIQVVVVVVMGELVQTQQTVPRIAQTVVEMEGMHPV